MLNAHVLAITGEVIAVERWSIVRFQRLRDTEFSKDLVESWDDASTWDGV